ncbi:hypothetical protein [Lacrimispora sp.]|uniref:hypothetical protein n=1 Tax=Lacrimispora sp. TaxID=2719234 RepID=UPI0032E38698
MKLVYIYPNAGSTESDLKTIVLYMTPISNAPIWMPASHFAVRHYSETIDIDVQ